MFIPAWNTADLVEYFRVFLSTSCNFDSGISTDSVPADTPQAAKAAVKPEEAAVGFGNDEAVLASPSKDVEAVGIDNNCN